MELLNPLCIDLIVWKIDVSIFKIFDSNFDGCIFIVVYTYFIIVDSHCHFDLNSHTITNLSTILQCTYNRPTLI